MSLRRRHPPHGGGKRPSLQKTFRLSRQKKKTLTTFLLLFLLTATFAIATSLWYGKGCPDLFSGLTESGQGSSSEQTGETPSFEVVFLDVGQGDSQLVLCDGQAMLIDTGVSDAANDVLDCLHDHGITTLDYLVLTHPHADHIGGANILLENTDVQHVLMPDAVNNTSTYEKTLDAIEAKSLPVTIPEVGHTFSLGSALCTVLSPQAHGYEDDLNDYSLVLMVEYAGRKILFTGDTGREPQREMMDAFDLSCDVYKVAHHGSYENNHADWIEALSPTYAVISCDGVSYEHPHEGTVDNLDASGVITYRTDQVGTVTLTVTSSGEMDIQTEK